MYPIFPNMPAGMVDADAILRLLADHGPELCAILLIAAGSPIVDRSAFFRRAAERPEGDFDEIMSTLCMLLLALDMLLPETADMEAAA